MCVAREAWSESKSKRTNTPRRNARLKRARGRNRGETTTTTTKRTSEKSTRPESRRDNNNNNKHSSATWAQSAEPFRLPSRSACPPVFLMLLSILNFLRKVITNWGRPWLDRVGWIGMLVFIVGKSPPWSCRDEVMALSGWPAGSARSFSLHFFDFGGSLLLGFGIGTRRWCTLWGGGLLWMVILQVMGLIR